MNNTQFSILLHFTVTRLPITFHSKHISTYSLSRCRHPGLTLGPFLWGGGDTSTTSGDGGGTSTTSRGQVHRYDFLLTTKNKNNSPQLAQNTQLHTVQMQKQPV